MQRAGDLWAENKGRSPYPKSKIPEGMETTRLLEHHYIHWHDMFAPRQLLALATLLGGIMAEKDGKLQERCSCAPSQTPLKETICSCATFRHAGLRAEPHLLVYSRVTTISPR